MLLAGEEERVSRPVPGRRRGEVGGGVCRFGMGIEIWGAAVFVVGGAVEILVSLMGVWWWALLVLLLWL